MEKYSQEQIKQAFDAVVQKMISANMPVAQKQLQSDTIYEVKKELLHILKQLNPSQTPTNNLTLQQQIESFLMTNGYHPNHMVQNQGGKAESLSLLVIRFYDEISNGKK